jgi:hypothetical protein
MAALLRTEAEIRAAGAAAVEGWTLSDATADRIAALLQPVAGEVWRRLDDPEPASADAEPAA